jgi:ferredoxin
MIDKLKQRIRELLEAKTVGVFLGHEQGDNPELLRPVMVTSAEDVVCLVYNETPKPILCKYLLKPEVRALGRRGIIASPADVRGLVGLIQESQLRREDVYILAISNGDRMPEFYDELIEGPKDNRRQKRSDNNDQRIKELMALTPAERRAFWDREFSRCIKCYACRQICPMCYCNRCIADKNQPQWIPTSPHQAGNFMWNVTRAYHLAGRCIDCGECERACPVAIPLMLFNKMIYNNIKVNFNNYEAGFDPKMPPPLATYRPDDQENFII